MFDTHLKKLMVVLNYQLVIVIFADKVFFVTGVLVGLSVTSRSFRGAYFRAWL